MVEVFVAVVVVQDYVIVPVSVVVVIVIDVIDDAVVFVVVIVVEAQLTMKGGSLRRQD